MMKSPKVSVVFVNYNGKEMLLSAIASLKKSSFHDFETIVVDNASKDGSVVAVEKKFSSVKIIKNKENLGYTGINTAMKSCRGEYILFLNNDIEIEKDAIKNLVDVLDENSDAALAVPKLVNFYDRKIDSAGTWVSRSFYNGHFRSSSASKKITEIPYMGIGLIRKEIITKFGYLFDPDYFIYAEDLDLGIRIRLLGMKTLYVPDSTVYHMHSQTMKSVANSRKTYLMERNLLSTFYKNMAFENLILFFPYVYAMRLATILRDIFTLKFSTAFARIRAIFSVFFMLGKIMEKRKKVQFLRKVSDSYILEAFSEKYLFSKKRLTI